MRQLLLAGERPGVGKRHRAGGGGGKRPAAQTQDLPFVVAAAEEPAGLSLEDVERRYIAQVLASAKGHISNAAKVLRINRTTLYHKIKKYGLAP